MRFRHPVAEHSLNKPAQPKEANGGATKARTFALIISLAHVHNISPSKREAAENAVEIAGKTGAGPAIPSQLHVKLDDGGRKLVVTCASPNE